MAWRNLISDTLKLVLTVLYININLFILSFFSNKDVPLGVKN